MSEQLPEFSDKARFVTVKEAIALLGLSDRTIRRYVAALPPHAVATPKRGAVKYRLADLAELAGKEPAPTPAPAFAANAEVVPPHATADNSTAPTDAEAMPPHATAPDAPLVDELRARIAGLETDKAQLWEALQREQETARLALSQLDQARREYGVMIAAVSAGRISPYGASDAPETGGTVTSPLATPPPGANRHPDAPGDGPEPGTEAPEYPARDNDRNAGAEPPIPRRWWEFWRKKEEG